VLAVSDVRLPPVVTMVFGLSCTVVFACVLFTIWSLALVATYTGALVQAADEAEMTWASSTKHKTQSTKHKSEI
jgi:hypothetical protein